jgi:hypothetical protein
MTAANTKHGKFSAHARAEKHHVRAFTSRNRLVCTATLLWPYLPPDMAARLARGPAELFAPTHPSNLPYLTPQDAMACNVKDRPDTSATPASARRRKPAPQPTGRAAERLAVRAEAAAQAPWREAIAQARVAERAIRQARAAWRQKQAERESSPSPLAGLGREERTKGRGEGSRRNAVQSGSTTSPGDPPTTAATTDPPTTAATTAATPGPTTPAPAPTTWQDLTLLQREVAFRLAGLRGPGCAQPRTDAVRTPKTRSNPPRTKSPGRIAIQSEPTARPGGATPSTASPSAPSAPARPASHKAPAPAEAHPSRPPLTGRQTEPAERIAVQRERPAAPRAEPLADPTPPAPLNRAARRRLKCLQRRRDHAARPRP